MALLGILTLSVSLVHSAVVSMPAGQALAVTPGSIFLSVSDGLDEVHTGENVSYTISLRTDSAVPQTVDVHFYVPQGTDFVSASEGGSSGTDPVRWQNVVIHPDTTKKLYVTMQVRPDTPDGHLLVAEVTAGGERSTDTTRVTEKQVGIPPLEIRVNDGRVFAEPMEALLYEISVDNRLGPDRRFTLRAPLPQFLDFLDATGNFEREVNTIVWNDQFIAAGERAVYTLTAGIHRNTPEFTSIRLRVSAGLALGSDTTTVILNQLPPAALSLSVDDGYSAIRSGQKLTYEIIIRNNQSKLVSGLEVTNALPTYTEFVSATDGGYWTGTNVHWKGITVSPNGQRILHVTVRVRTDAPLGAVLQNSVQTSHGQQAVDRTSVAATAQRSRDTQVQVPQNVLLRKVADRTEVRPGDLVRYSIIVRNTLDHPVQNVTVEDRVDTVYSSVVDAQNGTMHGDTLVWTIPQLAVGQEWSVHYTVRVHSSTPHGSSIANVVTIYGDGLEQISLTERVRTMRISVVSELPPSGAPLDVVLGSLLALLSAGAAFGTRRSASLLS